MAAQPGGQVAQGNWGGPDAQWMRGVLDKALANPRAQHIIDELVTRHASDQMEARVREYERDRLLDELLLRRGLSPPGSGSPNGRPAVSPVWSTPNPHDQVFGSPQSKHPPPTRPVSNGAPGTPPLRDSGSASTDSHDASMSRLSSEMILRIQSPRSPDHRSGKAGGTPRHAMRRQTLPAGAITLGSNLGGGGDNASCISMQFPTDDFSAIRQFLKSAPPSEVGTDDTGEELSAVPRRRRREKEEDEVGDEVVTYSEEGLNPEDVENASADQLTRELFKRYDRDRDGRLNRMEYGEFLKHISHDDDNPIQETYRKRLTMDDFKTKLSPSRVSAIRRLLLAPPIGSIATVDGVEGRANGKRGRIRGVRRDGLVEVNLAGGTREVVDPENLIWEE